MKIPQEVMDHMADDFAVGEVSCLAHLLQMLGHALCLYVQEHVPDVEQHKSIEGLLTTEQIAEANTMLAAVIKEYGEFHQFKWLTKIVYVLDVRGLTRIGIPDGYDAIMEAVQAFAATTTTLGGHSNIRRSPSGLN